MNGLHLIAQVS